jgi:hypothetical protein
MSRPHRELEPEVHGWPSAPQTLRTFSAIEALSLVADWTLAFLPFSFLGELYYAGQLNTPTFLSMTLEPV